jgi:L-lactate dehydrogenase complex protein LldE
MKISLMITCLADVLRPEIGIATVNLLRRLGHEIDFPAAQTCCGQPMFNSGFADLARDQAKHTIAVFEDSEVVVVPSGSCAAMVKVEYPELLHGDEAWHRRAVALSERTYELSSFLVHKLGIVDVGAKYDGVVTYHYACHGRMLGVTSEVEQLLNAVAGLRYIPIARQDQCCGFGGSFSVRYPEISTAMVNDKVNCILATQAEAVVSTDMGCLMNIGGRLRRREKAVEIMHIAELLERR